MHDNFMISIANNKTVNMNYECKENLELQFVKKNKQMTLRWLQVLQSLEFIVTLSIV